MKSGNKGRRRPSGHITLVRAARLYRMIATLSKMPLGRDSLLETLSIGLRTFYRELELLKKCGIRIRLENKLYTLKTTAEDAAGRLPFPDPQLSFAEMGELAQGTTNAARRLADLLARVTAEPAKKPSLKRKPARKTSP